MKTEILLTFAVLLITAAPVWAIPSAGTYQWDSGGPLSGSFTSDGSALTTYEMASTTGPAIWTLLDNVIGNTTDSYVAFDTQLPGATADLLVIEWELNQTKRTAISVEVGPQFSTIETFDVPFRLQPGKPIPEPTTLMLLSTGLVGLVGYRWRQGRREGQQVG